MNIIRSNANWLSRLLRCYYDRHKLNTPPNDFFDFTSLSVKKSINFLFTLKYRVKPFRKVYIMLCFDVNCVICDKLKKIVDFLLGTVYKI